MKPALDWTQPEAKRRLEQLALRLGVACGDLARMASGLERLNGKLLGPEAAVPRPLVRIPARLLRDVSPGGGLEVALRCCVERRALTLLTEAAEDRAKQIALLAAVTEAMRAAGVLKWPRIAWDDSVPAATRTELARIARAHCAEVVARAEQPSHVVCWDDDVDGSPWSSDREYLTVLAVDQQRPLALVHWWYAPDSNDEWIEVERVQGSAEKGEDWCKPLFRASHW